MIEDWRDWVLIISFVLNLILFLGITLERLYGFYLRIFTWTWLKQESIRKFFFTLFIILLTLFLLWALTYLPISKKVIFDGKWALLFGIVIWSLVGIWIPLVNALGCTWSWLAILRHWVGNYGWIPILIGFWVISLPKDWLLPLILTIIVASALLFVYGYNRWKTKPKGSTKNKP